MRILLDEHLSPTVAEWLRAHGLDAVAVSERPELRGQPDERLMGVAAEEDRAIVTNDVKDFRPIARRWHDGGRSHAGLVFIPKERDRARSSAARLASAIELLMITNPNGLANAEVWVRTDR